MQPPYACLLCVSCHNITDETLRYNLFLNSKYLNVKLLTGLDFSSSHLKSPPATTGIL